MRKLFIFIFLINSTTLFGQVGIFPGLNSSWNNTAKTHDVLGFDVSLITIASLNNGIDIQEAGNNSIRRGGSYFGTFQLGLGLPKNTDLIIRFCPSFKDNFYSTNRLIPMEERIGIYGIGIKHDLLQWIPIAEKAPIDLSVMVGYSQAKYILNKPEITSSISGQITYPETQDEHLYRATTINLLLSKKIAFFTPLIGVGLNFNSNKSSIQLYNSYFNINNGDSAFNNELIINENSEGQSSVLHVNFGARFNLVFMTINTNYAIEYNSEISSSRTKVITLGLGFSLR